MDCEKYSNKILFYLDKELSKEEVMNFELHLSNCPQCKHLYEQLASVYKIISQENSFKASPFFYNKLKIKIESDKERKIISIFTMALKPLAVAASIALGIIIGNGELSMLNSSDDEIDMVSQNITPPLPADYSVWTNMNEDNGNDN